MLSKCLASSSADINSSQGMDSSQKGATHVLEATNLTHSSEPVWATR